MHETVNIMANSVFALSLSCFAKRLLPVLYLNFPTTEYAEKKEEIKKERFFKILNGTAYIKKSLNFSKP